MRRSLLLLLTVALAAALAPAAQAQPFARYLAAGATVSLRDGHGYAQVSARGGILGGIARGRVVIRDVRDRHGTDIKVWGADWTRVIDRRTTVYGGVGIRFRALRGAWRVRMIGRGINASAAGRGYLALKGKAGTFSIDGGAYDDWPETLTKYRFGE